MIYSCAISEGVSKLKLHVMRADGTAACSNYLYVVRDAPAHAVPTASRCRAMACRKLFEVADSEHAQTISEPSAPAPSAVKGTGQRAISHGPSQGGHGTALAIARNSRGRVPSMCRQVTDEEMTRLSGYEGATLGLWDPSAIANAALGADPTPEALFTYCYRRFGQPLCPSDQDKELACYLLTTPMPDVFLVISIRAPGCSAGSFGYLVEGEIFWSALREYEAANLARRKAFDRWLAQRDVAPGTGEEARVAAWREFETHHPRRDHANQRGILGKVHRALRASIKELARPTSVRDSYFNALGPVDEGDVRAPVAPFDSDAETRGSI